MSSFIVLTAAEVSGLLTAERAIESQRRAFTALQDGTGVLAPKVGVDGADGSLALNYTARISLDGPAVAKFVSVNPTNTERGLPTINAVVSVLDAETGQLAAVMDGTTITTLRTAAASAVAVDALASARPQRLAIIGTGVQADAHVRALTAVRDFERITIIGRDAGKARALADRLSADLGREIGASGNAEAVVPESSVVALCTASFTPVVEHGWLAPGTTLVSIGSFTPDRCEVQRATVTAADLVVVDDLQTSLEHAGPIMRALETGALAESSIVTIGSVLSGDHPGRAGADDIVFYNSVGVGTQDAAAAAVVLEAATAQGLGLTVEL